MRTAARSDIQKVDVNEFVSNANAVPLHRAALENTLHLKACSSTHIRIYAAEYTVERSMNGDRVPMRASERAI